MIPSTVYGNNSPPVFKTIFVEDPPQVLFSLKIAPSVNCPVGVCYATFLENKSKMNLTIENLYSPQSVIENSIDSRHFRAGHIANAGEHGYRCFPKGYTLWNHEY